MNSREKYYEIDLKALREAIEEDDMQEMDMDEMDMDEVLYEEDEDDNLLADNLPEEGGEEPGNRSRTESPRGRGSSMRRQSARSPALKKTHGFR